MRYLILALDGGGVRLVLQWKILSRILERFPNLLQSVSLFAGVSAGSILASALACGMPPSICDKIISPELIDSVFQRNHSLLPCVGGIFSAKYSNAGLKSELEKYFGTFTISQVPRSLFIPAFQTKGDHRHHHNHHHQEKDAIQDQEEHIVIQSPNQHLIEEGAPDWMQSRCKRWTSIFFHNLSDSEDDEKSEPLVRAIMKSSAAPYYFPMVGHTIDGGVAHNNPSLAALSHLLALKIPLEDIYILSLGTGEKPQELDKPADSSLGIYQWLPHLIDILFDANEEATSQSCHEILGDRFHRVQPLLDREIPLDSAASYNELCTIASEVDLSGTISWIEQILE